MPVTRQITRPELVTHDEGDVFTGFMHKLAPDVENGASSRLRHGRLVEVDAAKILCLIAPSQISR